MAESVYDISLTGMNLERARLEAATYNISIANTVASSPSQVAQLKTAQVNGSNGFEGLLTIELATERSVTKIFKPEHVKADEKGFIYKPKVNLASEMIQLNLATRAYEANVRAFNSYKQMSSKAMEIGK